MVTGALLGGYPRRAWFTLDELAACVLADVIAANTQFMRDQASAWKALLADAPVVGEHGKIWREYFAEVQATAGLRMTEVEISVELEPRRLSMLERIWRFCKSLFVAVAPVPDGQFRPRVGKAQPGVLVKLRLQREADAWKASTVLSS